jgi:hypothetical protein
VCERRPGAAVSDDDRPLDRDRVEDRGVRRPALDPLTAEAKDVHRRRVGLDDIESRHCELVRRGHVRAGEAACGESAHGLVEAFRRHVERDVCPVEAARGKGGVLHPRRQRVRDRMAEQGDESCP